MRFIIYNNGEYVPSNSVLYRLSIAYLSLYVLLEGCSSLRDNVDDITKTSDKPTAEIDPLKPERNSLEDLPTNNATKFLAFGDFGTNNHNQKQVADAMVNFCKAQGCNFAVTTGDNIYPRGVANIYNGDRSLSKGQPNYDLINKIFVDMYKRLNIPIYLVFGNHDIDNEGLISSVKKFFIKDQKL